ncbi:conserved hypothetical protein [Ricinus communis]|uniref:Uncharacterized protein n=1 Tax=Ricinus communis TaxID=3988 RepID=B9TB78_RICCO|nr:conserved hypothetical protein [Ricinus communis]
MPRSRITGNSIDKTFVAKILLRIIPTTSGEKEAFTYYRDGEVYKENNSFCRVSPINAASDASIVDSSIERKVNPTPLVPIGGIKEEALRLGINNTKPLLEIFPFPYWDRD